MNPRTGDEERTGEEVEAEEEEGAGDGEYLVVAEAAAGEEVVLLEVAEAAHLQWQLLHRLFHHHYHRIEWQGWERTCFRMMGSLTMLLTYQWRTPRGKLEMYLCQDRLYQSWHRRMSSRCICCAGLPSECWTYLKVSTTS